MSFSYIISPKILGQRVQEELNNGKSIAGDNINSRRNEHVIHALLFNQQDNGYFYYDPLAIEFVTLAYKISSRYSITFRGIGQTYDYVIRHFCANGVSKENVQKALDMLSKTYIEEDEQLDRYVRRLVEKEKIWLPHAILAPVGLKVSFCTDNGLSQPPELVYDSRA